jgi:hypothetical protein
MRRLRPCPTTVMPANLTPEYRAAGAAFRKARDPRDRLACLREMLRVMPKHRAPITSRETSGAASRSSRRSSSAPGAEAATVARPW